jgi:hypothetical protein
VGGSTSSPTDTRATRGEPPHTQLAGSKSGRVMPSTGLVLLSACAAPQHTLHHRARTATSWVSRCHNTPACSCKGGALRKPCSQSSVPLTPSGEAAATCTQQLQCSAASACLLPCPPSSPHTHSSHSSSTPLSSHSMSTAQHRTSIIQKGGATNATLGDMDCACFLVCSQQAHSTALNTRGPRHGGTVPTRQHSGAASPGGCDASCPS